MTGLENMSTRLNYAGGAPQIKRMNEDKLKSLDVVFAQSETDIVCKFFAKNDETPLNDYGALYVQAHALQRNR